MITIVNKSVKWVKGFLLSPLLTLSLFLTFSPSHPLTSTAQPNYNLDKMHRERLDRGVVAIRQGEKVVVSWRTLRSDAKGQSFDLYRNGEKLNQQPLTDGGTFYIDEHPAKGKAVYEVRGGEAKGSFTLAKNAPDGYLSIPLQKPADGVTPDERTYTYTANDASVADVDGDGQYEIILKWDPSNAHDNAHDGFTGPTLFDCYRLDGTRLWRIDMGINIRSGAHYVPFIVYDFDGDGRAELMVRTADGTRDSKGHVIGDSQADYRHRPQADAQNPTPETEWGKYNHQGRPMTGRILTGPEYITVFNGLTGEAMDSKPYIPQRGNPMDWGDSYANRSDRMLAGVGYLDGVRASGIFCRGYYTRTVIAAWDWDGRELKNRWTFDTKEPEWASYAGQGNHNLRVADVDGDGCDEIIYGSMAIDHNGRGLYNTGMGHGDAIHLMAFDPSTTELQIWDCHENRRDGSDFRKARTGEVIFQIPSKNDVGRCMAADIDPTNPGVEMWSSDSHGIRTIKGEVLSNAQDPNDPQHQQHLRLNGRRLSVNFGIWWDGDLLRELLDHETVTKYDWEQHTVKELIRLPGIVFNNGTKSNPCLAADILGDWREEVIARTPDNSELRIFVSPIPTDYRIDCLMEDIPYRLSTAAQNVGYNQPSEPGFYLGPDKTVNPFLKSTATSSAQQVNDNNTPLHLMKPAYQVGYGVPTTEGVKKTMDRVLHYIDAETPAQLVDKKTGKAVNPKEINADTQLKQGGFRLTSYEWGVTYSGVLAAYEATGDEAYRDYVFKRHQLLAEMAPYFKKVYAKTQTIDVNARRVIDPHALDDAGAVCCSMIKGMQTIYKDADKSLRQLIDERIRHYADYIMTKEYRLDDGTFARHRPQKNTVWLDDMFMGVPTVAYMGKYTGEQCYYDEAAKQIRQFASRMWVESQGLFRHGWVEAMEPHPAFHWGRANGWAILTLCEVLDVLPENHPERAEILALLRAHAAGLARLQHHNGFWHQLLDRNDTYLETSATAIYTYCLAHAVNQGWLDAKAYGPVALLGWQAVEASVNEKGQVMNVCVGTGMGFDAAFYAYRPVHVMAAHGYGPVIWAGAEMIRLLQQQHPKMNDSAVHFYDNEVPTNEPIFNYDGKIRY